MQMSTGPRTEDALLIPGREVQGSLGFASHSLRSVSLLRERRPCLPRRLTSRRVGPTGRPSPRNELARCVHPN